MKFLFLLNMDITQQGPSVHLINDIIIKAAKDPENEITIIAKKIDMVQSNTVLDMIDNVKILTVQSDSKKQSFFKRYINDFLYAKKCAKIYKNMKFDSVFLQSCNTALFHIALLKRYLRAKVLFNVQDIFPENLKYINKMPFEKITYPVFSYLQKKAYQKADSVVTISEDMADVIRNKVKDKETVSVIHNWGYSDEVTEINREDNPFYKENIFDKEKFNVVYAGNIGLMQNVEVVVKAAKKLKANSNIHFYIVGGGQKKSFIEKYVIENSLANVTLLPMQSEDKAPYIYSAADVNVIPLAPEIIKTALPSKTPACLASGKALIACIEKDSELAGLLDKTDGCFVASNTDETELAEKIEALSLSNNLFFGNREEALQIFSSKTNSEKYVEILECNM